MSLVNLTIVDKAKLAHIGVVTEVNENVLKLLTTITAYVTSL